MIRARMRPPPNTSGCQTTSEERALSLAVDVSSERCHSSTSSAILAVPSSAGLPKSAASLSTRLPDGRCVFPSGSRTRNVLRTSQRVHECRPCWW
jgi:hypothetical protein